MHCGEVHPCTEFHKDPLIAVFKNWENVSKLGVKIGSDWNKAKCKCLLPQNWSIFCQNM